jgi:hypothetical protein
VLPGLNPGLCVGGRSELGGVCNVDGGHKGGLARRSAMLVAVLMAATLLLMAGIMLVSYRSFKLEDLMSRDLVRGGCGQWKLESFHPLELDADEIYGVGEESLIGSGGTGRMDRLELKGRGGMVVVKLLLKGNAARVMEAEMAILGKVRHRNILKLG